MPFIELRASNAARMRICVESTARLSSSNVAVALTHKHHGTI